MPICNNCKGHGVTRYVFKCKNCSTSCYLCENVNKVLQECSECYGTGKIKISKKNASTKFDLNQIKTDS